MEKQRKEELLKIVAKFEKKLEEYASTSFIGFLATSSKTYYLEKRPVEEYFRFMFYSGIQAKQYLGAGNAGTESYKKFLKEELKLTKRNETIIVNSTQFASMNMEEIAYVFGWLRRVVVDQDKKSNPNKNKGTSWNNTRSRNENYSNSNKLKDKRNRQNQNTRSIVYESKEEVHGNDIFDLSKLIKK